MIWLSGTIIAMAFALAVLSILARIRRQKDFLAIQDELDRRDEIISRIQSRFSKVHGFDPNSGQLEVPTDTSFVGMFRVAKTSEEVASTREHIAFDRNVLRWVSSKSLDEASHVILAYDMYISGKGAKFYGSDDFASIESAVLGRTGKGRSSLEAPNPWFGRELRTLH